MEVKNAELRETESKVVVTRGWGGGSKGTIPVKKSISSGDLMCIMAIIANNTVLCM